MPDFTGRLRPPRLAGAPASPALGEVYFDTPSSKLMWWSGTAWVAAAGGGGAASPGAATAGRMTVTGGFTIPKAYTYTGLPGTPNIGYGSPGMNNNGTYTCPNTGLYHVIAQVWFNPVLANQTILALRKNGTASGTSIAGVNGVAGVPLLTVSDVVQLNASDTVDITVMAYDTATTVASPAYDTQSYFAIYQL